MRRIASYTKYLFAAEATIHDVVEHQQQSLKQKLDELGSETILARPIQELTAELVEAFRLEVPGLNRSEITQLPNEEIDIDVFARSDAWHLRPQPTLLREGYD